MLDDTVLALIREHPEGIHVSQIRGALRGNDSRDSALVIHTAVNGLLQRKLIRTVGHLLVINPDFPASLTPVSP